MHFVYLIFGKYARTSNMWVSPSWLYSYCIDTRSTNLVLSYLIQGNTGFRKFAINYHHLWIVGDLCVDLIFHNVQYANPSPKEIHPSVWIRILGWTVNNISTHQFATIGESACSVSGGYILFWGGLGTNSDSPNRICLEPSLRWRGKIF